MNGKVWGAVFLIGGLSMAAAGWKLLKAAELPPGAAGFSSFVTPGKRGLIQLAGNGLLILGLILAFIISSFFFVGG